MDPISLTAATLIAKALQEFATEAGRGAWKGLGQLVATVRSRLAGDRQGRDALARVEAAPADGANVRALAEVIDRRASEDSPFRDEIIALVRQAERDPAIGRFVTTVSGEAHVGKVVNIERIDGDVTF